MWKKITLTVLSAALLVGTLAGCGSSADQLTYNEKGQPVITMMTSAYQIESAKDDSPVLQAVEEKLGMDLDITWVASASYGEKVTATMGAGTYPMIMRVSDRSAAIIANCRGGTFWEIGDKMLDAEKYPNLAQANKQVMNNMSVDGKVYGVYSSRDLGRNGVSIRKDWLENLGLEYPKTIAEFRDVLKQFTENDPDGNGKKDTYGMIMTSYTGPIDNIVVWFGAPNGWGMKEETNRLEPSFMFDEYFEAIDFLKECFDNGWINSNWATMDPEKWNEPFMNGRAGVIIDVADRARRLQTNIVANDPNAVVGVFGSVAVDENSERRVLPTTGYNGFFTFPKESVKTEEELEICLTLLDRLGDADISDLMQYGIEGRHYEVLENGDYSKFKDENGADIKTYDKEFADLNQLCPFITANTNLNIPYATATAQWVADVIKDNANYAVANPAAPYVSDTYALKGTALDTIMAEATTKYITGVITKEDWYGEIDRWKKQGGDKVIEEINIAHQEAMENAGDSLLEE